MVQIQINDRHHQVEVEATVAEVMVKAIKPEVVVDLVLPMRGIVMDQTVMIRIKETIKVTIKADLKDFFNVIIAKSMAISREFAD